MVCIWNPWSAYFGVGGSRAVLNSDQIIKYTALGGGNNHPPGTALSGSRPRLINPYPYKFRLFAVTLEKSYTRSNSSDTVSRSAVRKFLNLKYMIFLPRGAEFPMDFSLGFPARLRLAANRISSQQSAAPVYPSSLNAILKIYTINSHENP